MTRQLLILAAIAFVLGFHGLAGAEDKLPGSLAPLDDAAVRFEQNATDGDVEVVFEVTGNAKGLSRLTVTAPDGRQVIDFTAPDASKFGIRTFVFESPEPQDVASLKAEYPEGVYTFAGATVAGKELSGKATLSHKLPATVSIVSPKAEAEDVSVKDMRISWTAVKNVAAYIIEIEQEELNVSITAKLPASPTTFAVPNGFLLPGKEYKLAIGTVAEEGNLSFVETEFATAANE